MNTISNLLLTFIFSVTLVSNSLADTVEVPPPVKGTLLIEGSLTSEQLTTYFLNKCEKDAKFKLKKGSCGGVNMRLTINQPAELAAGVYLAMSYAGYGIVEIEEGKETRIRLANIKIPAQEGTKFRLFSDFTDKEKFDEWLLYVWGTPQPLFDEIVCTTKEYRDLCERKFRGPQGMSASIATDSEANFHNLKVYSDGRTPVWVNEGRFYTQNKSYDTGTTWAVFPGTYGVEFIDSRGIVTLKLGIKAK